MRFPQIQLTSAAKTPIRLPEQLLGRVSLVLVGNRAICVVRQGCFITWCIASDVYEGVFLWRQPMLDAYRKHFQAHAPHGQTFELWFIERILLRPLKSTLERNTLHKRLQDPEDLVSHGSSPALSL